MGDNNTTLKVTIKGEDLLSGDLRQLETEFVQIEASAKKLTKSIKDVYTSTDDEQFAIQAQWNQAMNEVQAKTAASMAATRASIAAAVDASEVKIKGLALSGVTSVDRLSNAFKGLNIKSQFDIEAERTRLIANFSQIKNSGVTSATEISRAQQALRLQLKELENQQYNNVSAQRRMGEVASSADGGIATLISRYGGLAAAIAVATKGIKDSVDAAMSLEKINSKLEASTGSAEAAGLAWQFVRKEANRLGLEVKLSADAFADFATATRNTSNEGLATQKMFTGFMTGFTALQKSADESNRVIDQVTQGFNKGKLELEDLKIIAEAGIPVFELLSSAMGKSRPEIMKMISDGQLLANEVYPKLAAEMEKVYGATAAANAQKTAANYNRLKNEVLEQAAAFGKDLLPAVNVVLEVMSGGLQIVGAMVKIFKDLTSTIFAAGFAMAEFGKLTYGGGIFSEKGRKEFVDGISNIKKTLVDQFNDMGAAQSKYYQTEAQKKAEADRNEKRRQEENRQAMEANKKATEDYIKTIADEETRLTAKYRQEYEEKKKVISAYYDSQLKTVAKGSADEIRLTNEKADSLAKLERERATDRAQVALEVRETALKQAAAQMQAEIALIEQKLAKQEISEQEAAAKISALRKQQADEELKLAQQRVSVLATAGLQGTEEYRKALGEQVKAQKEVNGLMMAEINRVKTEKKAVIDQELSAAQNAYQADLNSLQEAENNKSLSVADANLKRLQLARDYAEQVAAIRAKELADAEGQNDPKAYEAALKAKLDADKNYLTAREAINAEEAKQFAASTAKHAEEIKNKIEAEKAALEQSRAFAENWFAQWDAAYNNASKSLQGLSDAAYNTFAEIEGLPLKSTDSLDALKKKAEEAATSYGKLYRTAQDAGLKVGAAWSDAYTKLNMIPAEAARITAEYYRQKVAAEELAVAIAQPTNATSAFVTQSQMALREMNLLDNASLDKLHSGIDAIKNAMLAFTDQIKSALKSLQDEWDNLTMSKLQLEEKRYNEQKLKWEQDYQTAKQQGNDEAIKALKQELDLIEKIHKANVGTLSADKSNTIAPKIPGMKTGGGVGGSGTGDTQLRWLDPREWVLRPEATGFWGGPILTALNSPWSAAGQMLADRINGLSIPSMSMNMPRTHMFAGGNVGELQQQAGMSLTININGTGQIIDETFVRRKIIPEIERVARLRA